MSNRARMNTEVRKGEPVNENLREEHVAPVPTDSGAAASGTVTADDEAIRQQLRSLGYRI
ncbi:hypothetical protein SSCG_03532 [Streptomyces clavuligerus]|nr:hypothetical protein SSCG_03532 [Streptomyces clavuligerus]